MMREVDAMAGGLVLIFVLGMIAGCLLTILFYEMRSDNK